ncbi:MAG TPA: DNA repair protein RadA [Syntrophomonadaceae bacterium]|jgi:DNA repair protein RadA/Sms|nr:DNA repair protein RadA [Syntrophomonadaceae bacterium]HRX21186.1 DNA repair protein RadA [Syntrophomonadaceae bacterium]
MGKISTKFVCNECAYEVPKWMGKCPGCNGWNTFVEESITPRAAGNKKATANAVPLSAIADSDVFRFSSGNQELDRVLGGGIVPGSLILLGGDPGIGKSTLLLQVAHFIAQTGQKVIYLSGEESLKQIRLRSLRMDINSDHIYLVNEPDLDYLSNYVDELNPGIIIIDSIQTVFTSEISSVPGSISQLRECTARLMELAKKREIAIFLVGHVTKDGALAGPKVLEHIVDVVIYFEGDKNYAFRLLRGIKNRFGSTDEIGILEMSGQGLKEVADPSYIFIDASGIGSPGTAITASFEGTRPLLIELQALVSASGPGYPRRMASGIDQNRLALIIAVLEKRCSINLSAYDVYLKVTGGMYLKDPSVDLSIAAAITSSYFDRPLPSATVFVGELGLSGQIRQVPFLEQRLKEIQKMGYSQAVIPGSGGKDAYNRGELEVLEVNNLDEFMELIG